MNWTDEQLAAINFPENGGKSRSAVVTAAAGSGKTALLVQRVIRILCDTENPVPADKIAIMTFTRNAAEEFRRRMTDAVAAAAKAQPGNPYLAEQLIRFRSAPICTINSFCLSILRDNAESFGLPVGFSIIDETRAALLQTEAMDVAMEYFYSNEFDAQSRDLLFKTFSFRDDKKLTEAVSEIREKLTSLASPQEWLDSCCAAYGSVEAAEKRFMPYYISALCRMINSCRGYFDSYQAIISALPDTHPDKPKLEKMLQDDNEKLLEAESFIQSLGKGCTLERAYSGLSQLGLNAKGTLRFAALSCKDEYVKNQIEPLRKKFKETYKEKITPCLPDPITVVDELPAQHSAISALAQLVRRFSEEYTALKHEAGYVDFADCERLLLDKLRSDRQFRSRISQRFDCIIIDEFQDTNDIQYEIFRQISDNGNNLFFVGDIKQSIYAFRGGNPGIMRSLCEPAKARLLPLVRGAKAARKAAPSRLTAMRRLIANGTAVDGGGKFTPLPLNRNFRSRAEVINAVNAVFTGLMTKQYGDVDYDDSTRLFCGADYPQTEADYTAELHLLDYGDADDKIEAEARYTAALIADMLKRQFPIKSGDTTRPCRAGDFGILLRSSTNREAFENALQEFGIKVRKNGGSSYLASEEITLVLSFLKTIDNPLRDEELLSVLMSPVFGFTAEELAKARLGVLGIDETEAAGIDLTPLYEKYKGASLFACISACARAADSEAFGAFTDELSEGELAAFRRLRPEGHPKCVKFIAMLTQLRSFAANCSIERLIRRIYDDTDFFSVISAYEQGGQRLANIRLLLKYAADFENSGGGSLGDFLRYTDKLREKGESFVGAVLPDNETDSVQIMTFHASKGLEMPIVILAELGKNPNKSDMNGAMVFNRNAGLGLRYVDIEQRYRYKPFGYTAIALAEEEKQKSEELRLLYVAMTRAREKLIMIGKMQQKDIAQLRTRHFTADFAMSENRLIEWIAASLLRYSDGRLITQTPVSLGGVNVVATDEIPQECVQDISAEEEKFICQPNEAAAERIAAAIKAEYPYQADSAAVSKFTVTEIAHMNDNQHDGAMVFMSRPSFMPKGSLSGKEVGDAYHHAMEHFPLEPLKAGRQPDADFAAEVLQNLHRCGILDEAELKAVNPLHIVAFFGSALGQRMLNSGRIEREYPIFAELPTKDIHVQQDGLTIVQGRADMFFYEDDGIVLVDYKSDTKENLEKELEAYAKQLDIYRTLLPIMTGVRVKEIYIYSFSCDMAVAV